MHTFKIGAFTWTVTHDPNLADESVRGKCYRDRGEIHVDPTLLGDQYNETILHELIHACNKFVGVECDDKLEEEEFVTRLAPVLYTMLKENGLWRELTPEQ